MYRYLHSVQTNCKSHVKISSSAQTKGKQNPDWNISNCPWLTYYFTGLLILCLNIQEDLGQLTQFKDFEGTKNMTNKLNWKGRKTQSSQQIHFSLFVKCVMNNITFIPKPASRNCKHKPCLNNLYTKYL